MTWTTLLHFAVDVICWLVMRFASTRLTFPFSLISYNVARQTLVSRSVVLPEIHLYSNYQANCRR